MRLTTLLASAAVAAALALPAQASGLLGGNEQNQNQGQQQGQHQGQAQGQLQGQSQHSININSNKSSSSSRSSSSAAAGAAAGAAAVNKGNAFSSTTNVDASTRVDAEPAYAPNVSLTSSGCIGSVGVSGGGLGVFSVGFGTTWESEDCFKIEAAKVYLAIGDKAKAVAVLESIAYIGQAAGKGQAAAPASAQVAVAETGSAPWPQRDPVEGRAFRPE